MAGRNGQISRVYALLSLLEGAPQGLTVGELTDRVNERGHKASKRTVYRDLEALNAAGFALFPKEESEDSSATRWVLEKVTRVTDHLVVTARELIALYLAKGALSPLKDTPFYDDLESVFRKLEEKLGTKARSHLDEVGMDFRFEPGPRWGLGIDPDLLETVRACCAERQILEVTYSSASKGEKKTRKLGPHYLYFAQGSLYLVAEDLQSQTVKVFSVPRMSDAKMLDEEYSGQITNPENYFEGAFGIFRGGKPSKIKIEFSPTIASYVRERRWHSSQSIVNRSDGSIHLSLETALSPELLQWVLGFGAAAYVAEPIELRSQVEAAAAQILETYRGRKVA